MYAQVVRVKASDGIVVVWFADGVGRRRRARRYGNSVHKWQRRVQWAGTTTGSGGAGAQQLTLQQALAMAKASNTTLQSQASAVDQANNNLNTAQTAESGNINLYSFRFGQQP